MYKVVSCAYRSVAVTANFNDGGKSFIKTNNKRGPNIDTDYAQNKVKGGLFQHSGASNSAVNKPIRLEFQLTCPTYLKGSSKSN